MRRYCAANATKNLEWGGNEGPVTRNEVETALGMFAAIAPVEAPSVALGNGVCLFSTIETRSWLINSLSAVRRPVRAGGAERRAYV